jgi:alpha-L-rhamnosidase
LSYATTAADYPGATTGKDLIATAFYAHSTDLLARTAAVLGRENDARVYAALFERIKTAFNREFVTPPAASARPRRRPTCWPGSSTC